MLAIGYAALVALLHGAAVAREQPVVSGRHQLVYPRLVGRLALVGAAVVALMLAVNGWRHRRIWTARLWWPLLGWLALCLVGLAAIVLISQPPSSLARHGLGQVASIPKDFDVRHSLFYVGFAVVAARAWPDRVSLPVLGAVVMAYSCVLEVVQEFVPTRAFLLKDLVSNGVGILLGLCWVYLYDALFGESRTDLSRSGTARCSNGRGARASMQSRP
jgi:VanZ like family